jgi:glycosyltransferase involved in cell wall biosynthesis
MTPDSSPVPVLLMSNSLGHGGGERQLASTALSLDRSRFTPAVACCEGGFQMDLLRQAGVPAFSIGSRSLMSAAAFSEARRLRRYIREHGIRIVQTFDFSMNVFGIPIAASVPGVVSISNLRCHMHLIPQRYRWLNHLAHRISKGVVVNSEALRNHLHQNYKIPRRKIFTCYNGVDTGVFRRAPGLDNASLVIGALCVLRPEKNLALLLEAFAVVSKVRGGLKLMVVGSGPEESALKALANTLDIERDCIFHPSTRNVPEYLSSMEIFVLPSLTEGLSNAVMEAMACGCCVIASDVGGNPELVLDGKTGLLFPSQDRQALIDRLMKVICDAGLRRSLAKAGAERMRDEFSIESSARRMQEIYDTLLNASGKRTEQVSN